jgi:hypothetical protein
MLSFYERLRLFHGILPWERAACKRKFRLYGKHVEAQRLTGV